MKKILTITMNPAIDVSTDVEQVTPVRKLRCGPPRRDAGGGGINVARVLKRLGADVTALFPAGGSIGALLASLVAGEQVAAETVPIAAETRENFTAVETGTGQQFRFVLKGPALSPKETGQCLKKIEALLPDVGILVASGSLPEGVPTDFYASLARLAAQHGVTMVLDTSGAALKAALGNGLGLIKPNLRELTDLTGKALEDEAAQIAACRQLIDEGAADAVALTLAEAGALLIGKTGAWRAKAPEVEIRSAVGAGDSFTAGMVWGLASGWPMEEAFGLGVAAGSAAVMSPGTDLCAAADVWRLAKTVSRDRLPA